MLLDASFDVNGPAFTEGEWQATPLWYAVSDGKNLTLGQYLLDRGASPEHCLWAAAYNDSPAAIRLLVRAGAVVDAPGKETPFLFAVRWSRFERARALLDAGSILSRMSQPEYQALENIRPLRESGKRPHKQADRESRAR